MIETTTRPAETSDTAQQPVPESSPDPDPGVDEQPKTSYAVLEDVEDEPDEPRRS